MYTHSPSIASGYIATVNKAVVQQVDALLALNLKLGRDRTSYEPQFEGLCEK